MPDDITSKYIIKGTNLNNIILNCSPEKIWLYEEGTDNRIGKIRQYKQIELPAENFSLLGYNENPKNRATGDCVIRALSTVYKCSWHEALDLMAEKSNYAEPRVNSTLVINKVLKALGFEKHSRITDMLNN